MTLWWIGSIVLCGRAPGVVVSCAASSNPARDRPQRQADRGNGGGRIEGPRRGGAAGHHRSQVEQTVAGVAGYGGWLDVIVDEADGERA